MNHEDNGGSAEPRRAHHGPMGAARRDGPDGPQGHRPAPQGGSPKAGAPSSNTAPSNCNGGGGTQILRVGIDSLYLSYAGEISTETAVRLKELKTLAKSSDSHNVKLAQYPASGHLFKVHDRGSFPFEFILSDNWYRVAIAGLGARSVALAHAKLASQALTLEGPQAVVEDLDRIVAGLGAAPSSPSVSRVDLCVDFTTDAPLDAIVDADWVTRARDLHHHTVMRRFSGWSIGGKGDLSARLYDKTLEIRSSRKEFFEPLWRSLGWDGESRVWRLEFQFRRDVLREFQIVTFADLLVRLGGLWQYASCDWLRLAIPGVGDKTASRWPTSPVWMALQSAPWGTVEPVERRPVTKGRPPSDRSLFVNGLAALTSFMAREGIAEASEGAKAFFQAARDYHNGRDYLTGLSFDAYVAQKVGLKARQYNSFRNLPEDTDRHPMDEAVARAYRKARDGE